MSRPLLVAVAVCALPLAGCGDGPALVPVSGKVTLDGKPLANVWINFQPIAADPKVPPGPGSSAKTDAEGQYTLRVDERKNGAVVGKHKVMIQPGEEGGDADADAGGKRRKSVVPAKYIGVESTLRCDVPAGGKADADFALTAK